MVDAPGCIYHRHRLVKYKKPMEPRARLAVTILLRHSAQTFCCSNKMRHTAQTSSTEKTDNAGTETAMLCLGTRSLISSRVMLVWPLWKPVQSHSLMVTMATRCENWDPGEGNSSLFLPKRHYVTLDPRWVPKPISIYCTSYRKWVAQKARILYRIPIGTLMAHKGISNCTANIEQALEQMLGPRVGPEIRRIRKRHYVILGSRWVPKPMSIYDFLDASKNHKDAIVPHKSPITLRQYAFKGGCFFHILVKNSYRGVDPLPPRLGKASKP